jgi:hypothetical protein
MAVALRHRLALGWRTVALSLTRQRSVCARAVANVQPGCHGQVEAGVWPPQASSCAAASVVAAPPTCDGVHARTDRGPVYVP